MSDLNCMNECHSWSNTCVSEVYHHLSHGNAPLAMGYVPYQEWSQTYEPCKGLQEGTIFPCLHKPFCGKGGTCR